MSFNIRTCSWAAFAIAGLLAGPCSQARAQSTSGVFGSSGPMSGSAGLGTSSSAGLGSSGNSAFPTTQFPASQFPSAQFGASSGQTGMGQSGLGATGQGQAGQRSGLVGQSNPMIAGVNQAGQTGAGQNTQMQNSRQGQGQNRNNANNRRQGQNQNQAGAGANNQQQQRAIRPQLIVAFDRPAPKATKMAKSLATRFDNLSGRAGFEDVAIEVDGTRVILRGEVGSEAISRMAAMLARLQPGVKSIQNDLVVVTPEPGE